MDPSCNSNHGSPQPCAEYPFEMVWDPLTLARLPKASTNAAALLGRCANGYKANGGETLQVKCSPQQEYVIASGAS